MIAANSMAEMAVTDGRQDNINAASVMLRSWGWAALLAGVVIAAFIGAIIGKRALKNIWRQLNSKTSLRACLVSVHGQILNRLLKLCTLRESDSAN